jgi:ABC-type transport system involved in cytochrome bd biosynthesis fused ATPase/permease subunit
MMVSLQQLDARAVDALERIATTQIVLAVVQIFTALVVVVGILFVILQLRAFRRMLQQTFAEWKPQIAPLLDRAKSVTDDVAGLTDNVRRKVDDALHTLEDLRRSAEKGGAAAEERVRRFGEVLDVLQTETEDLLLDAAAAARGVHETARALRRPARTLRQPHSQEDE